MSSSCLSWTPCVAPLQYKNSCLNGEIYRAKNCTSNDANLEKALDNIETIFRNNQYPNYLIKTKISEIKHRDFGPNPNKALRIAEQNCPELKHFYLSLPFTSFQCSKVGVNLKNILQKYTPNFRLKICFKTITLEKIILPKLKPIIPLLFTPNTVYLFTCDCSETYIGHTKKLLKKRIQEHRTCEASHIFDHISTCAEYNLSLGNKFPNIVPSDSQKRTHIYEHFTALSTNLPNYFERIAFEGLMITQLQPTLNKQLKFKKSNLICSCITRVNDVFEHYE